MDEMEKNEKKKILAVNCSPRKVNSYGILKMMEEAMTRPDVDVEIINLGDYKIKQCLGDLKCLFKPPFECIIKNDDVAMLKEKFKQADGYLFAIPVYINTVPGRLKDFMDRCTNWVHSYPFTDKYAAVATTLFAPAHDADRLTMNLMRIWLRGLGVCLSGEITIQTLAGYKEAEAHGLNVPISAMPGVKEKCLKLAGQLAADVVEKPKFELDAEDLRRWKRMHMIAEIMLKGGFHEGKVFERNGWFGKSHWTL